MAGTIVADTLTHSTAGSIATNYVVNGSAKAWVNYDCASTTPRDSLNVASLTDNGTGYFTTNFSNAMNNDDYCVPTSSNNINSFGTLYSLDPHTYSTTSVGCDSFEANTTTVGQLDSNHNHLSIFGDLA